MLGWASDNDGLIIEDDYEYETNYRGEPTPALKSLDREGECFMSAASRNR
ncbi:MAG: hypothetical protein R3D29_14240 [Nitratireductor sp.]